MRSLADEVITLRQMVAFLWGLLDDIDTLDDACRSDDRLYRLAARKLVMHRWGHGITTDGYNLFVGDVTLPKDEKEPGRRMMTAIRASREASDD